MMTWYDIIEDEGWALIYDDIVRAPCRRRVILRFHLKLKMEQASSLIVDYNDDYRRLGGHAYRAGRELVHCFVVRGIRWVLIVVSTIWYYQFWLSVGNVHGSAAGFPCERSRGDGVAWSYKIDSIFVCFRFVERTFSLGHRLSPWPCRLRLGLCILRPMGAW